jgi:hypothetical protein
MARARAYIDIHKGWSFAITEAQIGTGKTLRVKFSLARSGDPTTVAAIGSLSKSATAVSGTYTVSFTPTELATDLAAVTGTVYAHLYDSAVWRDTIAYQVTAIDEDLLPELTG